MSDDDKAIAAIATIEFSRQTHVEWRDWLRAHPEDRRGEVTGDADYHEKTITEYDNVLAVLRASQLVQVEVTEGMREKSLAEFADKNLDEFVPEPIAGGMRYSFNVGWRAALSAALGGGEQ